MAFGQRTIPERPSLGSGPIYCPGCGVETDPKRDKWQRPCLICFLCGFTIFCRSRGSEAGFWLMQRIIRKNPKAYRAAVVKIARGDLARRRRAKPDPTKRVEPITV